MELEARVAQESGVTVLSLKGKLSFENQSSLETQVTKLIKKNGSIVVDMADLDFVGSSGITVFLLNLHRIGAKFCNVSLEFRKVMKAYKIDEAKIMSSRADAVQSFFRPAGNEKN